MVEATPNLELISRFPDNPSRSVPVLFVHGAFCGAWVWDEHFLPYFAENGYEAHALSLRGHGRSEAKSSVHLVSLTDYVADLTEVLDRLDTPPVLVGHSLGGVVVQKWLKRGRAPGAVLMGSGPPHGMLPSSIGMLLRDPALVMQLTMAQAFGPWASSRVLTRRALFSDSLPAETVDRHFARASAESLLVGLELAWPDFPGPTWSHEMPMLVLGAENDFFVSPTMVEATARVYGTREEIFPDMAHAMMLEPGWQSVADRILRWLRETVPPTQA
jgi:pimeloyl-ACP methyl ester carboxylesterase